MKRVKGWTTWSAGHAGLFHGHIASTAAQDFDDVKIGYDNNADLDIDDGGDSIVINDDFASNSTTLSYDDNGNLTDDGLFKFAYDAWNRLVAVKSRYSSGTTQTTFATYAYDGANRRTSKVVTNNGVEVYPNDGGNTTVHFYYVSPTRLFREMRYVGQFVLAPWNICEARNASNQSTWQSFWGTQYIDEMIFTDKNGDPTIGNDCDPDGTAGEASESRADHRYLYHQDRNWNVIAASDGSAAMPGSVLERTTFRPYGDLHALVGDGAIAVGETGDTVAHQGLPWDAESGLVCNRLRLMSPTIGAFTTRDPLGYYDSPSLYLYQRSRPTALRDPSGLSGCCCCCAKPRGAERVGWIDPTKGLPGTNVTPGYFGQHIRARIFITCQEREGEDCQMEWWETALYTGDYEHGSHNRQERCGQYPDALMCQQWRRRRPCVDDCSQGYTVGFDDAPSVAAWDILQSNTGTQWLSIDLIVHSGCEFGCACRTAAVYMYVYNVVVDGDGDPVASYFDHITQCQ
ncbi:MAG: hypothetical protein CHACPFDD_01080 [Phycisphaerae bacterium]|nr:hypothetical protein [Phycisphaerae bacterium]